MARNPKRKLYVVSDSARKTLSRFLSAVNE
jgi:hypothetical protein